jgi:formylglycine-generating enzyme required for sulfatase activity
LLFVLPGAGLSNEEPGMVFVPGGEFVMGARDGEGVADEHPVHKVSLPGFWIDRTEVTQLQYQDCVLDARDPCTQPPLKMYSPSSHGHYPVVGVTWEQADHYCRHYDKRLPSEQQWEYAARGSDGRRYPWGNAPPDGSRLNFCDAKCPYEALKNPAHNDGFANASPVGSYPAGRSPFGVLDLAGNAWEWTSDLYDPAAYCRGLPPPVPAVCDDLLKLPADKTQHVLRGSAFDGSLGLSRSSMRYKEPPPSRDGYDDIGFRCVK